MNVHKNAPLTPRGREPLVELVKSGLSVELTQFDTIRVQPVYNSHTLARE